MVLKVYGCFAVLGEYGVRFAGEKGSCDLFPTLVQTCSIGVGLFRGKLVFVGTARAVRTKTQLAHYKTKKRGYTPKGKKAGRGAFLGTWIRRWSILYLNIRIFMYPYI